MSQENLAHIIDMEKYDYVLKSKKITFSRGHAMVDRGSRAGARNWPNLTRARCGSQIFGSAVAH